MPWWLRICAKMVLSRLPISYSSWKRLRLFEHGVMNQPQMAWDIFLEHATSAGLVNVRSPSPQFIGANNNFSVLEFGPGDSLFSAVIAHSLGASHTWMVDVATFATQDMAAYSALFDVLRSKGLKLPFKEIPSTVDEVINLCNGEYLTNGVKSFAQIPSASLDFCFSNAALEHVRKEDFSLLVSELFRVLKPGGVCVHRVDLKDHLGGRLNNLRFSEVTWEGALFRESGFYTNRIRFGEMVSMFTDTGFDCHLPRVTRWSELPLSRTRLAEQFQCLTDLDLLVSGFDIVLRHKDTPI